MTGEQGITRARLCALISAALLAAVALTGGLRSAREAGYREEPTPVPAAEESVSVFRADRDAIRMNELAALEEIASDASASGEIRTEAHRRRMALMAWMEQEAAIEEVLCARGYDAPVVTVHEDSVNVAVRAEALSRQQAGIILELVTRETGVTGGNVKIIPIN